MARATTRLSLLFGALLVTLAAASTPVRADSIEAGAFLATTPSPREVNYPWMNRSRWFEMHAEDVALAEAGKADLVFIGDSITEGWETTGAGPWSTHFAARGAVNFGIGGDMTQNLLWRLDNAAASALDPDAVVLLIGVNNLNLSPEGAKETALGIESVVGSLLERFPHADLLLLAVFPTGAGPDHPTRAAVQAINTAIRPLGDLDRVTYLDLGDRFLETDGRLDASIMPDYLHLSELGYERWAASILPWVEARVPLPAGSP